MCPNTNYLMKLEAREGESRQQLEKKNESWEEESQRQSEDVGRDASGSGAEERRDRRVLP